LELSNCELDAKVRELEGSLARAELHNRTLEGRLAELGKEFDQYKHREKEELLFGVSSFMNIEHPVKRQVEESTLREDSPSLP
jgi:hypothetical protein